MAQVELITPVKNLTCKFGDTVMRRKKYRAPNGAVLREGVQESYIIKNPRDFKKNPPKGNEAANMRTFGESSFQANEIIRAGKLTEEEIAAMPEEQREHTMELRAQLAEFEKRFYAQFKAPDSEAPFEKKLKPGASVLRRKQYVKIDTFIQAILRQRKES